MKDKILEKESKDVQETCEIEKAENGEKEDEKDTDDGEKDKEVLLIQDTGFNIQIAAPNLDPFDLPVSKKLSLFIS